MFSKNKELIKAPLFNTENVTSMQYMFNQCSNLKEVPLYNTRNVTDMMYMFYYATNLEIVPLFDTENVTNMSNLLKGCIKLREVPLYNAEKVENISTIFQSCTSLEIIGGFLELGKAYTQKTNNYTSYKLDLSASPNITHDSLMNVINNLYDLNLTYDVANGGTLYRQSLVLGNINKAKLTTKEIAIATNKGWDVT